MNLAVRSWARAKKGLFALLSRTQVSRRRTNQLQKVLPTCVEQCATLVAKNECTSMWKSGRTHFWFWKSHFANFFSPPTASLRSVHKDTSQRMESIVFHILGFLLRWRLICHFIGFHRRNLHKSAMNSSLPWSWWSQIKPPLLQLKHLSVRSRKPKWDIYVITLLITFFVGFVSLLFELISRQIPAFIKLY